MLHQFTIPNLNIPSITIPALAVLALAQTAVAEPQSDEIDSFELDQITVTADLRQTTVRKIPTSVTVLDAQTLEDAGLQHFQDVMQLVPNLNWSSASSRPRYFQIRGIGERSQYEGAPNPSVGFLIDDIDFSGIGGAATLFDTEQIEVLRGPQGTRYGANALAGLINVRTVAPSFQRESRIEAMLGDHDTWSLGFIVGGAVGESERAAYRVSVQQFENNGFRYNDYLDSNDSNGRDEFSGRVKFLWQPSADWELNLTALFADIDNRFDAFAPENTLTVHSDKPGQDAQESLGIAFKAHFSGWSHAELISTTTVADSDIIYSFDGDWGNDAYWGEYSPYDFTSDTRRQRNTWSQELRLVSKPEAQIFNGTSDWLLGVYLLDLEEDNRILELFNGFQYRQLDSAYAASSVAAFGQLDVHLNEITTLTAGLRVERRSADYRDSGGLDLSPSDTMLGGQLSLTRELNPRRSAYLTLARGYKAGGFNLGLSVPEDRRRFDPEYLWNLEAGVKGMFAEGRLYASLAIFYAERDKIQVGTSFQIDPTDPLTFVFYTDNAASGNNYGLEAEARFQLSPSWRLYASLGLLQTEFDDFQTAERDLSGRAQAHAPNYQLNLAGEYRSAAGYFVRADFFAQDSFYFSDSHDQISEAYQMVNLKLGYEADHWAVYAWGRNIFDQQYATRGFFFGLEPPDYPKRLYLQQGDPAQFGVTARVGF